EHGLAPEIVISFIDQYCSFWGSICNTKQICSRCGCTRRIVGTCERDHSSSLRNGAQYDLYWKSECAPRICLYCNYLRAGALHVDLIHREGRDNDQYLVPRLKIRFAQQVNRFVDAICKQYLIRSETKKFSHQPLRWSAFRILREFSAC